MQRPIQSQLIRQISSSCF